MFNSQPLNADNLVKVCRKSHSHHILYNLKLIVLYFHLHLFQLVFLLVEPTFLNLSTALNISTLYLIALNVIRR